TGKAPVPPGNGAPPSKRPEQQPTRPEVPAPQLPPVPEVTLPDQDSPAGPKVPVAPAGPQSVSWTELSNVTAAAGKLVKTAGCDGCPDAGARSAQQIDSGDGYLEFTATESGPIRSAGLASGVMGNG